MSTWAEKSKSSEDKVYCKICLETISVKSRGVTRMKEHGNTEKHKRNAAEIRQSRPLKDFFVQKTPAVDISDDVCDSEIRWCLLTAEHDLSYRFSDSACDTLKKMFPDSKIAEKMQCKRMKTMYVTAFGIGAWIKDDVISPRLRSAPFCLMIDEGSIRYTRKWLVILVRYISDGQPRTDFLGIHRRAVHSSSARPRERDKNTIEVQEYSLGKLSWCYVGQCKCDAWGERRCYRKAEGRGP